MEILPLSFGFNPSLMRGLQKAATSVFVLSLLLGFAGTGISQPFVVVNSGTRADIHSLYMDDQRDCYFLTEKINAWRTDHWERFDFPVSGRISSFFPVSRDDLWFSTDLENYSSILYHYHHGILENVSTPFSNQIHMIEMTSPDFGYFISMGEIATYRKGKFTMLPPSPSRNGIIKIIGATETEFWALSLNGEVLYYNNGSYRSILKEPSVNDIGLSGKNQGYVVAGNRLLSFDLNHIHELATDPDFTQVRKMQILANGDILLVGDNGLMMNYSRGRLLKYPFLCTENLGVIAYSVTNELWIAGNNGRLLYCGHRKFPVYKADQQGFSTQKVVSLGVQTNDEYGVAIADFDRDGKNDIYAACIYNSNRLYVNHLIQKDRLGPYRDFTEEAVRRDATGVVDPGSVTKISEIKLGVLAADLDNDGDQDIYLNYLRNNNRLLLNRGNGFFRNVSMFPDRASEDYMRSNATAAADVDLDGDLDIFITNEEGTNRLFLNDGTAHFRDITAESGLQTKDGGMCATFSDINNDGYPDLCVTFWYPHNRLYINETRGDQVRFREITAQTDLVKATPSKSNAVIFGDVNNDGSPDLFIGNRNSPNKLYINDGKGYFRDSSARYLPEKIVVTNGAVFEDFDMDGYLDLYLSNVGENILYHNQNGKTFEDITAAFGAEMSGYGTGCASGDLDADGDADLYCASYVNGSSHIFLNISDKARSVAITLKGTRSNRDAIGTKAWLFLERKGNPAGDSLCGYRELVAGSGYASCSSKEIIFGVTPGLTYYVRIKFPFRPDTITLNAVRAGMKFHIPEESGVKAIRTEAGKLIYRLFQDQETRPELFKYLVILGILWAYGVNTRRISRRITWMKFISLILILIGFALINHFFQDTAFSFQFFIAPIAALGALLIVHLYFGQTLVKRMAAKEKNELREKLSRDLHDELASTLGSISIYSNTLNTMGNPHKADFDKLAGKVNHLTREALQSISDIIWMTSPRNDTLQSLLSKTSSQMQEIFSDNHIGYKSNLEIPDAPVVLPENIRNDAFLIIKEAFHNILKHSEATEVFFRAVINPGECMVSVEDNGKGFDTSLAHRIVPGVSHGNGLSNMRKRADESGIDLSIHSEEGKGTRVVLIIEI